MSFLPLTLLALLAGFGIHRLLADVRKHAAEREIQRAKWRARMMEVCK